MWFLSVDDAYNCNWWFLSVDNAYLYLTVSIGWQCIPVSDGFCRLTMHTCIWRFLSVDNAYLYLTVSINYSWTCVGIIRYFYMCRTNLYSILNKNLRNHLNSTYFPFSGVKRVRILGIVFRMFPMMGILYRRNCRRIEHTAVSSRSLWAHAFLRIIRDFQPADRTRIGWKTDRKYEADFGIFISITTDIFYHIALLVAYLIYKGFQLQNSLSKLLKCILAFLFKVVKYRLLDSLYDNFQSVNFTVIKLSLHCNCANFHDFALLFCVGCSNVSDLINLISLNVSTFSNFVK